MNSKTVAFLIIALMVLSSCGSMDKEYEKNLHCGSVDEPRSPKCGLEEPEPEPEPKAQTVDACNPVKRGKRVGIESYEVRYFVNHFEINPVHGTKIRISFDPQYTEEYKISGRLTPPPGLSSDDHDPMRLVREWTVTNTRQNTGLVVETYKPGAHNNSYLYDIEWIQCA